MISLRRLFPDSIAGRIILILLVGLTLSHVVSMGAYHVGLLHELGLSGERHFAERMAGALHAIAEAPALDRDRTAHALSGSGVEIHWAEQSLLPAAEPPDPLTADIRERLREHASSLAQRELRVGYAEQSAGHIVLISMQLADGSWVSATAPVLNPRPVGSWELIVSTTLMAAAVILLSILSVRIMTAPLRSLARAAERLGLDVKAPRLPETGPREVRQAARAFNEMQDRIGRLVTDRTQMLAAVSHDLKTPITRMKQRSEFVDDEDLRARMTADLDEMEAMIASTLAFLREEATREETRVVDLSALIGTVCGDMADAGHMVKLDGAAHVPVRCRPLAVKRAVTNLVANAVAYGGGALVRVASEPAQVRVDVEDSGPGIPEGELEKVFAPFYRLELSRSRSTGGTGLGLSIARSIARAHGGDVELANRTRGGLKATLRLPQTAA